MDKHDVDRIVQRLDGIEMLLRVLVLLGTVALVRWVVVSFG